MNLTKEQLLAVKGLKLSGIVNEMDNNQLDEYCKTLGAFIEIFSSQEAELKKNFNAKDYNAFCKLLASVRDMLEKIQAINLANSSQKLLDEISNQKYKIAETHLNYLLAEISELSIEIQVVWQKSKMANKIAMKPGDVPASAEKTGAYAAGNEQRCVLVVDDVTFTLNSLKLAMSETKYKLIGVKSGAEALKFISTHTPDLFILDIEMPKMNGYELAEKLRSGGQTAPIIFLTGNAKPEYVVKAIEAGAVDFIVKPVNKENMLEKIKKYIG